jgi:cell division protein ZipA
MSELRWALLILGAVFILALVFWERRRPRQASGPFERSSLRESALESAPRQVREPPLTLPEIRARDPIAARELPVVAARDEPGVPVPGAPAAVAEAAARWDAEETLEPPAAEAEEAAEPEDPEPWNSNPPDQSAVAAPTPPYAREETLEEADGAEAAHVDALAREELPELPPAAPMVVDWPAENERRILALRLVAPQLERFAGRSLRQALAAEGFLLGQFAIFHKPDDEHRAVLSAASLTRPGTFDMETMDSQHYGGLSLFAVLPGPKPPRQAFDELVFAARNLNERLHGVLQDEQGTPLTPARIAQLRDQLRAGAGS